MAFGRPKGAATVDALFSIPFALAIVCNVAPALIVQPTIEEIVFVGGAHALFALRLFVARRGQQGNEIERLKITAANADDNPYPQTFERIWLVSHETGFLFSAFRSLSCVSRYVVGYLFRRRATSRRSFA